MLFPLFSSLLFPLVYFLSSIPSPLFSLTPTVGQNSSDSLSISFLLISPILYHYLDSHAAQFQTNLEDQSPRGYVCRKMKKGEEGEEGEEEGEEGEGRRGKEREGEGMREGEGRRKGGKESEGERRGKEEYLSLLGTR
jgi:hypothetical protein